MDTCLSKIYAKDFSEINENERDQMFFNVKKNGEMFAIKLYPFYNKDVPYKPLVANDFQVDYKICLICGKEKYSNQEWEQDWRISNELYLNFCSSKECFSKYREAVSMDAKEVYWGKNLNYDKLLNHGIFEEHNLYCIEYENFWKIPLYKRNQMSIVIPFFQRCFETMYATDDDTNSKCFIKGKWKKNFHRKNSAIVLSGNAFKWEEYLEKLKETNEEKIKKSLTGYQFYCKLDNYLFDSYKNHYNKEKK